MLDQRGFEIPDQAPVSVPTRLRIPQSRVQQLQAFIRHELSMRAHSVGMESMEEALDLDVEDLADFRSEYEDDGDPNFQAVSEELNEGLGDSAKPNSSAGAPVEGAQGAPGGEQK